MKILIPLIAIALFQITACKEKSKETEAPITDAVAAPVDESRINLLNTYAQVPDASALLNAGDSGIQVYAQCLDRYETELGRLKTAAESLGAKFILTILTPEVGQATNISTRKGVPSILAAAKKQGVEAVDLSAPMSVYTPQEITQMPKDGHWSAAGSAIISKLYQPILAKYSTHRASKTFTNNERPATFGDLDPNENMVLDGGKNIPYQLITNSQGLRMNEALTFPKTKQRILFLGDSQLYSPFLDNSQIATTLLQQLFPDAEIINAGVIGYTIDDHVQLLEEKAKFAEPDIIVLVTNPNDIGDFYFTQRNRLARSKKGYQPSSTELVVYRQLFGQ